MFKLNFLLLRKIYTVNGNAFIYFYAKQHCIMKTLYYYLSKGGGRGYLFTITQKQS